MTDDGAGDRVSAFPLPPSGSIPNNERCPLLANMVEGGRSPLLPAETWRRLGYTLVIYPGTGFGAAAAALHAAYRHLHEQGSSRNLGVAMFEIDEMNELMGFEDVWAFERRWAER